MFSENRKELYPLEKAERGYVKLLIGNVRLTKDLGKLRNVVPQMIALSSAVP